MRSALVLAVVLTALAGCKKGTAVTAPPIVDPLTVAGTWSGCIVQPGGACSPVSMTLSDSSVTDSSATVTGTGNWGANVVIHGSIVNSGVTLDATTPGLIQGWSYAAVLSGNSLAGTMAMPGTASTFQATFTRSP